MDVIVAGPDMDPEDRDRKDTLRPKELYGLKGQQEDLDRFNPIRETLHTLIHKIEPTPVSYRATVDSIGNLTVDVGFPILKLMPRAATLRGLDKLIVGLQKKVQTAMVQTVKRHALKDITSFDNTPSRDEPVDAKGTITFWVRSINS